jgi:hypothetical protein
MQHSVEFPMSYFDHIAPISYEGANGDNPLAFHHYDAKRQILGKSMAEHLRLAACYWHTFVWPGSDVFGAGTFDRPWHKPGDPMQQAKAKADAAFDCDGRDASPRRRQLRAVGRPRRLRDAAQHRPEARACQLRPLPADGVEHKHKIGLKGTS